MELHHTEIRSMYLNSSQALFIAAIARCKPRGTGWEEGNTACDTIDQGMATAPTENHHIYHHYHHCGKSDTSKNPTTI